MPVAQTEQKEATTPPVQPIDSNNTADEWLKTEWEKMIQQDREGIAKGLKHTQEVQKGNTGKILNTPT